MSCETSCENTSPCFLAARTALAGGHGRTAGSVFCCAAMCIGLPSAPACTIRRMHGLENEVVEDAVDASLGRTSGALPDGLRHEQQRKQLDARELEDFRRVAAATAEDQHQRRVEDKDRDQHYAAPERNARRPARSSPRAQYQCLKSELLCQVPLLSCSALSRCRSKRGTIGPCSSCRALVQGGLLRVVVAEDVEQVVDAVQVVGADDVRCGLPARRRAAIAIICRRCGRARRCHRWRRERRRRGRALSNKIGLLGTAHHNSLRADTSRRQKPPLPHVLDAV